MKLLKTFIKYATGSMFALLAGLITTPILTRLISTEEMGKYSMFITIGSLFASILYLGLDQSYVRFYNDESKESQVALLDKCLKYPMVATAIVAAFSIVFYKTLSNIIIGYGSIVLVVVFDFYLFGLVIDRFWLLKIRMNQKASAYSLLNVIRKLAYLFIAVVLYFTLFGDSSWSLIVSVSLAEAILVLGCRFSERGNWRKGSNKIATKITDLFKYGFPFIFSTTVTLIFHSTDKLMLNAMTDYNQVGLYSGAQNIVNLLTQVQTVFTTFWMPVAYEHYAKKPADKGFFIKINKIVSYGMLLIAILLLCTKDIVVLFLGKKYRDAVYVFPFLAFMPIMYTVSESTVMGINFMKKSSYHVWISLISALTNVCGNYFLIKYFGAKGAAISTGLSYMVFFIARTVLANRVYRINFALGRFFISSVVVYMLAIIASFMNVTPAFLAIAMMTIIVISILYRDILKESINFIAKGVTAVIKKR